ncbi:hypothetical protein [Botrimarina sp.]|uniref:hypothetical protein n=1 Tax=Botrimarina sp. TaxID=2795802 RepID=UPI0032EED890
MPRTDGTDALPTVLVTVDGLRAAALGAYGQTAYETRAFDAVAAAGATLDWCYAPTPDPLDLVAALGPSLGGYSLVTDDAPLAAAAERWVEHAEAFAAPAPDAVAETLGGASQSAVWLRFAEAMVASPAADGAGLWLHTRGLLGPWDAPAELLDGLLDEEDPAPELDPRPATAEGLADDDADARFAAACRYAMQVRVLDACLGSWLELADAVMEGSRWRLVLAGVGGYSLGEHGAIGASDPRLYSERQHAPVLIRDGRPETRFTRDARLLRLDDALRESIGGQRASSGRLRLTSASGAAVLRREDWMLRRPAPEEEGPAELYAKPDDRWEQNDVASIERSLVDALLAELAGEESGVAAGRDGL